MQVYLKRDQSKWKTAYQWLTARAGATMLVAAGVGILVWTAFRSPQPNPSEMALLALFASAFNVWGGAQFAKIGKADPKHARSAVRRLLSIGQALNLAAASLQEAISQQDEPRIAVDAPILVSQAEAVQLQLFDAIGDWDDVHPEALREVLQGYSTRLQDRAAGSGRTASYGRSDHG